MSLVLFLAGGFLLLVMMWLWMVSGSVSPPKLHYTDSKFNTSILQHCPILTSSYIPTSLWGKSGHIQTCIYGKIGRFNLPRPCGQRYVEILSDGATMTYDVFEPSSNHSSGDECTLLICPGMGNSSESSYIVSCVHHACENGLRCVVLNHLGVLNNVPLTAPRIFTYGGTEEYALMVTNIFKLYPRSHFIAVGFSLGANIVIKYLGENRQLQSRFLGAISCCQGYDALETASLLRTWQSGRYLYVRAMTEHQKSLLRRHQNVLFSDTSIERYGHFNLNHIFSSTSLLDIDEHYSHRRAGFKSCEHYYQWSSSRFYMKDVTVPVLLLNAMDDPVVPPDLHYIARNFAKKRDRVIFAVTLHGGHLAYFEGGTVIPNTVTWLDRLVVQYSHALVNVAHSEVSGSFASKLVPSPQNSF